MADTIPLERPNFLIIMSDEHDPAATGCYNHPIVKTPNLDRLAAQGVTFDNAYCNSPICVASRMSFITGKYVHQIGAWDNGSPIKGEEPTFAHYFEAEGYDTVLCGRMHMVGDNRLHGFGKRLYGDLEADKSYRQIARRTKDWRRSSNSHVTENGPGEGSWQSYDGAVTDLSVRCLKNKAKYPSERPWLLVSGLLFPHFPLIAPEDYYNMYSTDNVLMPNLGDETFAKQHPAIRHLRWAFHNEKDLPEEVTRRALASYYALVTLTDHNIGQMLEVIDNSHLKNNTIVIYTSDHGEMAGQHGIWQKCCFYEASCRVPLIVRWPGVPAGMRVESNVSLVDVMPTVMDMAGIEVPGGLPGESLLAFVGESAGSDRAVFSEYHAQGLLNAEYIL